MPPRPHRPCRPWLGALIVCIVLLGVSPVQAHELGLSLWRLTPQGPAHAATDWSLQAELPRQAQQQPVWLDAGEDCELLPQSRSVSTQGLWLDWSIRCTQHWEGRRIHIQGLNARLPDALLEVHLDGGSTQIYRVHHTRPVATLELSTQPPAWTAFFGLGLEHLAKGWDHLIFIALLAMAYRFGQSLRPLVGVITGFTLAHSLSLFLVLRWNLHLPMAPVEALIALSLALLAAHHLRHMAASTSLPARPPLQTLPMASVFGLVHGLGFADALRELGLPAEHQWQALLMFNLGLEAAQLLWLALLLMLAWLLRRRPMDGALRVCLYVIGALSSSWFLARLTAL